MLVVWINTENLIRSKQIKIIYKIIRSDLKCWNCIGKYWLNKYDGLWCLMPLSTIFQLHCGSNKFGSEYFLRQCSNIAGTFPLCYQRAIKSWNLNLKSFTVDTQNVL